MATTPHDIRERLVSTAEHCYYSGPTAGQMWLHDLSAYLQSLPEEDPRLARLAGDEHALDDAEEVLCGDPKPLAQHFSPGDWLDGFAGRIKQH